MKFSVIYSSMHPISTILSEQENFDIDKLIAEGAISDIFSAFLNKAKAVYVAYSKSISVEDAKKEQQIEQYIKELINAFNSKNSALVKQYYMSIRNTIDSLESTSLKVQMEALFAWVTKGNKQQLLQFSPVVNKDPTPHSVEKTFINNNTVRKQNEE